MPSPKISDTCSVNPIDLNLVWECSHFCTARGKSMCYSKQSVKVSVKDPYVKWLRNSQGLRTRFKYMEAYVTMSSSGQAVHHWIMGFLLTECHSHNLEESLEGLRGLLQDILSSDALWLPKQIDLCVRLKAYIRIWAGRFTARIHPSLGAILEASFAMLSIPLPSYSMRQMFLLPRRSTVSVLGLPARRQQWKLEN